MVPELFSAGAFECAAAAWWTDRILHDVHKKSRSNGAGTLHAVMCLSCTAHSAVDLNEARALLLIFSEVTVGRIRLARALSEH